MLSVKENKKSGAGLFKRFFGRFRGLPKPYQNHDENLTSTLPKPERQRPSKNHTITLHSSNCVSDFPFRVFVIVGKQGQGKTTLAQNLAGHYAEPGVPVLAVKTLEDMDAEGTVMLIDDLAQDLAPKAMRRLVENFRGIRHSKQTVVLVHHLLRDIPSRLLQLSERVIFFSSNINVNQPNAKINALVPRSIKHQFHEKVLTLAPYEYLILKTGKVYGPYSNKDLTPCTSNVTGEKKILNGSAEAVPIPELERLLDPIPEWNGLSITKKIIRLRIQYPMIKPAYISKVVKTTPNTVWKTLSNARKKGLIPK